MRRRWGEGRKAGGPEHRAEKSRLGEGRGTESRSKDKGRGGGEKPSSRETPNQQRGEA